MAETFENTLQCKNILKIYPRLYAEMSLITFIRTLTGPLHTVITLQQPDSLETAIKIFLLQHQTVYNTKSNYIQNAEYAQSPMAQFRSGFQPHFQQNLNSALNPNLTSHKISLTFNIQLNLRISNKDLFKDNFQYINCRTYVLYK